MNIVLLVLDTQRADHLGCYGYSKNVSPMIDSIAARGVVFEKCYAPNIPTHPSFTTMLTGKEAIAHDIVNIGGGVPIRKGVRMIQEELGTNGWTTAAVDTMGRHFSRGFDIYKTPEWDRSDPLTLRQAQHVTDLTVPLIEDLKKSGKPFFLFLHYWDPHTPYLPPAEFRTMFYDREKNPYDVNNHSMDPAWNDETFQWYFHQWMPGVTDSDYVNALYDAEIAYMDWQLRRVFAALEDIAEETMVLITADHGEILDEQLGFYDHHGLYEGDVHVPLILHYPEHLPEGKRVPGIVQNIDFAPTILELAKLPDKLGCEGKSLIPCAKGKRVGNYKEVFFSEATWEVKRGYTDGKWKYINSIEQDYHGRPMRELFDLENDSDEQHNIAKENPKVVKKLQKKLDGWVAKRLIETKTKRDPLEVQRRSSFKLGTPVEGETPGAGATPLHLRMDQEAAAIPDPEETKGTSVKKGEASSNAMMDKKAKKPMHGYVKKK